MEFDRKIKALTTASKADGFFDAICFIQGLGEATKDPKEIETIERAAECLLMEYEKQFKKGKKDA